MKEKLKIYAHLFEQVENLRKGINISVTQLCKDSHLSTKTYYKMKKDIPVKDECYWRLMRGICKGGTLEEIQDLWMKFGVWIYGEFS